MCVCALSVKYMVCVGDRWSKNTGVRFHWRGLLSQEATVKFYTRIVRTWKVMKAAERDSVSRYYPVHVLRVWSQPPKQISSTTVSSLFFTLFPCSVSLLCEKVQKNSLHHTRLTKHTQESTWKLSRSVLFPTVRCVCGVVVLNVYLIHETGIEVM
jgi:hypothetical protein